ncbi:transcription elongation factor GreB [Methylophaga sp. OBS3]|uniref:transcription elongation factor GreB n=1 Tax=Methylophaga sp. OBS3 TaxID=2991934 RepID=UPI0022547515|nr:transcription elongation factor GreB [Methylophaga sp. OBS3]MCX4188911.1 transcription elongation factor GreB [Methylophaga sp. OBS3]
MASSPYITPNGMFLMNQELSQRWQRRREVVQALAAAAAEGDRSENAEYIYRKKELRELDRRIRYLQKRIPDLKVVHDIPDNPDKIFFAAYVTLETESGDEVEYRIVGPDEIDHEKGNISVDSPLARALLAKTVDDEVVIHIADGRKQYFVVSIRY